MLLACTVAGCGGGEDELRVSAAASLRQAFRDHARDFADADVRLSFGASDELAAQIRRGGRPDVYAAANTALPAALHREGLVERPVPFAANRLVLAVPAGAGRVRTLRDVERAGVRLAVGSPSVPVGEYTRRLLSRLGRRRAQRVLRNVRTEEPDVVGIVGKLAQGAVDAGFVYATDVRASGGRLRAIELPRALRPRVEYAAAVVRGGRNGAAAQAWIRGLTAGGGRAALERAGFEPPGP
jgi:molybdate transport system substrate-binding protein